MILGVAMILAAAAGVGAQGNPTGTVRGQVVDPESLPVPGVSVTASSPALQGMRTIVTSSNGDFIIPFLPPGEYTLTFELQGFRTERQTVGVAMAETLPMTVGLTLASLAETVTVTGTISTEINKTSTVAETYKAESLERLPVARTLAGAVLLAPGVAPNGPNNNIVISGALSYENLFLINGVTVNENLRGQPLLLFIEDAIQETKISTAAISAEYGRFQGGVVNMITKSGGNMFSGSFRTSFTNDAWRALTPYPGDQTVSSITPTYELTSGGPIRRDKVWFFGAGRFTSPKRNETLKFTSINYPVTTDDKRGEAKVTYALSARNNLKASYSKRALSTKNNSFNDVMDLASLYDNSTDFTLGVVNYTSSLTNTLSLEGQYSNKVQVTRDTGSRFSDLVKGTPIWDRSRGQARFNSPTFCAVCGTGWLENRDNWDWFVKLSYFLSTAKAGSHNLIAGFDNFKEKRKNDNWQSGSSYRIQATTTIIDGPAIYPVFNNNNSTYIEQLPLVAESVGNDVRTYSAFVNDAWRYNNGLSLNLGLRYDQNRSKDQSGLPVVKDDNFSPRLGLTWDVKGDSKWTLNAGLARYVAAVSTALVDAGSAGGRTATYSYFYQGPPINAGSGPYLTAEQALPQLFNWFFANGGLTRATRNAPSIPGVTTKVGGGLKAPNSVEYSIGLARDIRRRGTWRVDYLYRNYRDLYGDFVNPTTGRVTDPTGRQFDRVIVENAPDAKRTYKGLITNVGYRLSSLEIGGNYTLSWSRGNIDGENEGSGPIRTTINTYPEYRQATWNSPIGYSPNDQRHKVRVWLSYPLPGTQRLGQVYVGAVQRFDSAQPFDAAGSINTQPYVANPGYLNPPSTVTYYFTPRNALRWKALSATDFSVQWSKRIRGLQTTEAFFRGVVTNIFNNAAVITGNNTILTAASPGSLTTLQPFNPFTTQPNRGANWEYGPGFGQPNGVDSYQTARTANFSVGIRF
jgi:outer membrane receptor for ferrienterochelin and colicin